MDNRAAIVILTLALLSAGATDAASQTRRSARTDIRITVDTSLADHALSLVCSGRDISEAAVRASPTVQAQIGHNSNLIAAATMDAYVEGLRGLSACRAPENDVFRVGAILDNPDAFRRKVGEIKSRQAELAADIAGRLAPYAAPGTRFHGALVLAVPYFSCGGFERGLSFFVDVGCLDGDISRDLNALEVLVAHETFHAIQAQTFYPAPIDAPDITDADTALSYLFATLLREGSALYVSGASDLLQQQDGGPFTRLTQSFGRKNADRLEQNFSLLSALLAYAAEAPAGQERVRAEAVEDAAFDGGAFEEFGYYVGARMAGDIEAAWGREALVCVMVLPAEQFVLAHDAATNGRDGALRLGSEAVEAARQVGRRRAASERFESCRR